MSKKLHKRHTLTFRMKHEVEPNFLSLPTRILLELYITRHELMRLPDVFREKGQQTRHESPTSYCGTAALHLYALYYLIVL